MKRFAAWICALMLMIGCIGDLTPAARAAQEAAAAPRAAAGSVTYYVSAGGRGGNSGFTEGSPLPGLDAVPWDQLLPGDSVLLKRGDTFPGSIRMVGVHGTADDPVTIGAYGTGADPVIEARGQGIWLPETGNDNGATPGKYASAGVLLYDCSYVTVSGLEIVNRSDALKTSFIDVSADRDGVSDHSSIKLPCAGVAVAADGAAAAEGIALSDITVRGDSDVQTVMTETSSTVAQTNVTKGAAASARTFKNAAGTYYVSSLSGSDSCDGTSPDRAFYSLHKINELNLQPGAKVYLEYGSVFENQYLHIEGGGSAERPIIIDAYGKASGPRPLINTNGNGVWYQNYRKNLDNDGHLRQGYVSSSILIYDVEYIEVKNIAMTNFGRYGETEGADFANLGSYDGGTVPGETGYGGAANGDGNKIGCYQWGGKMARTGVAGVSQNVGTMDHVYLQNLDIENVYGNVAYKHMDNGGIYFTVAAALDEGRTGIPKLDDLRIEGCYLKRVSRWGIAAAYTGAYSGQFGGSAIGDEKCQKYGVTNLYIGHNYLEEVGSDPITTMYAYEPLVEYNVSYNGGREMGNSSTAPRYMNNTVFAGNRGDVSAGIWPWKCKTALFEHNECYTMLYSHLGANNDGQAWDADSGDSTIYQYNYSAGNSGACVMFCGGEAYNSVFRYNISYKDGTPWALSNPKESANRRGFLDPSSSPNGQFYNNTFVVAEGTPVYHYTSGSAHKVENNIFYNLGNEYAPEGGWNAASGLRFVKNIYVGFAQTGSGSYTGKDASPITLAKSDALFAGDVTTAPEAPKSTSKAGVRTVNGIRDWTHDWTADFNMFKLDAGAAQAINAGLPHSYDCLNQDSDFGVPRVDNSKDFYGNALDSVHDIGAFDTQTAGGEAPQPDNKCELIASLYELRGNPKTELHVPFTTNNPMTVGAFIKGLTVSDGADVKVYSGDAEQGNAVSIAAGMTVKIIAENGTVSGTVYTIRNKNSYNHKTDFVQSQQGNVWFHQTRQASTGDLVNLPSFDGGDTGWWTGGSNTCAEYNGAADDDTASRTYNGTGFVFRAPATGKVTSSFPEMPKFRYPAKAFANSFSSHIVIYRNGRQIDGQKFEVPKPASSSAAAQTVNIPPFDLTVAQGDTIEFMVVNEGAFTSTHQPNCADVLFNVAVAYKDEAVAEAPADTKRPTAPGSVRVLNVTRTEATVTWTASTDNVAVTGYKLQVNDGAEETLAAEATSKALTGLTANTQYTVTVKAVDAAGNKSSAGTVTFRTAKAPDTTEPTAPTGGQVVGTTPTTATIAWTAATDNVGVDHYEVTVGERVELVRNATRFTLTGLTPNTAYSASIKAVDAAGNVSDGAATVSFTTTQDTEAPTAPGALAALAVTHNSAVIRWTAATDSVGVAGYELKVDDGAVEDVGSVLQYTLTGLEFGTYTVSVRAYDEAGNYSAWTGLTFQTIGSSACELTSSLYELRDTNKLQVPYTDKNPMTVERFRIGLTVSEDAAVKVFTADGRELSSTENVAAGMTVKLVAQDGTENPTTCTIVQKNEYDHFNDWINNTQGNVWFSQYKKDDAFHSWEETMWNPGGWYSDDSHGYASAEQLGACDDIRPTAQKSYQGSGFTFRAPANGMVQISFPTQPAFRNANCANNTYTTYLVIYKNGVEFNRYPLPKSTTQNANIQPFTVSLAQEDTLEFMITNEGSTSTAGNGGTQFTPKVTYLNETYVPDPTGVTMSQTAATIYTNTAETAERKHTVQLSAAVQPAGANPTVTWSSSNESAATVDETGLVTAVGKGTTVIRATATASTGETVWGSCAVTVNTRIEGITVKKDGAAVSGPIRIYVNKDDAAHPNSVTLTAEPAPADPTHPTLNWIDLEDPRDIISIEGAGQNGTSATITAIGNELDVGEVTVRAASADHSDVCTDFTVEVFRFLEHNVHVTGDAKFGSALTASIVELEMTDEAKAALQYQWYRDSATEGNEIAGAGEARYVVTTADIGHKLVVTVTADEATFYEGIRTAETDTDVVAADGPAAPSGLIEMNCTDGDNGQIIGLDAEKVYEYKLSTAGDDAWVTVEHSTTIDNLVAGTYLVRIAATGTTAAGAAAIVTILPAGVTAAYTITAAAAEGGVIGISASQAVKDTEITVTLTPNTGYKLVEDSLAVTYTDGEGKKQPVTVTNGVFTMPEGNVTVTARFTKKTFTITHDMDHATCDLSGEHQHTVEYGDSPVITFIAAEGYTMPVNMQVTYVDEGGRTQTFYDYIYSRSAADPDTATLRFTSGITTDLTVTAVIPAKTFTVSYTLTNGLKAPAGDGVNARAVGYKQGYIGKLAAEDDSEYTLPLGIQIKMGGEPFTEFAYDSGTGSFTIGAGKITGDLTVIASGVDASIPVNPVDNLKLTPRSVSVMVGGTVTLTATVIGVDTSIPATDPTVIWTSSNREIATVEAGVVTGVAEGTAIIRATTVDGGIFRTCTVSVAAAADKPAPVPVIPVTPSNPGGDDTTTTTTTNPDGSTTTTVTDKETGTVTATTEKPDGSTEVVETKPDGTVTETNTDAEGGKVEKVTDPEKNVAITVTDPEGEVLAQVELPAEIPEPETRFEDVPEGHWADQAIHSMAAMEVVKGVGDDRFDMDGDMTRGALATVLSRLSNGQEGLESSFADVPSDEWYADGIAWAARTGIVTGYSETEFGPNDIITREQLAVMLCRYARLLGMDTTADSAELDAFNDGSATHDWAADSIAWCVANGILRGMGNGTLAPTATATRAQVAVMLQRFISLVK